MNSESLSVGFENARPLMLIAALAGAVGLWLLVRLGLAASRSVMRREILSGLRAANLLLLAFVILEPVLNRENWKELAGRTALLIDTSDSMLAGGESTRLDRVEKWRSEIASSVTGLVEYWFDGRCLPAPGGKLRAASDGQASDLVGALETVAALEENLSALVLVSDGIDNGRLRQIEPGAELPPALREQIERLDVPVNTVAVQEERYFDLALEEVNFPPFAYVRNAVDIEVRLRLSGPEKLAVPVTLEHGGRTVDSRTVELEPGKAAAVRLRFLPDRAGQTALRVRLPTLEKEAVPGNNQRSFLLRVLRDKIRVLHVVGRPQWDVRFLREVLRTEPNIDLVSFYILRNLADAPAVSEDQLSLIPFPVHELFGSQLDTFDLVIFQNFNHAPYQVTFYLGQIADYVKRGGAFLMIGGELAFGSGGYAYTPLEGILPVRLLDGEDYETGKFHPLPLQPPHPVLEAGPPVVWSRLDELDSFQRTLGLAPGAEALLVHPFHQSGGERLPVLALRQVGRGRSAAVLTDSSWRWRFGGEEKPWSEAYHRLWRNLLYWLIGDPALEPLRLETGEQPLAAGRPLEMTLERRGQLSGKNLEMELIDDKGRQLESRRLVAGQREQLELAPLSPGEYRLKFREAEGGKAVAEEILLVGRYSLEEESLAARPDLLQLIARSSGGVFQTLENAQPASWARKPARQLQSRTSRPLLADPRLLAALVLMWAAEWWLRRRWGFS